MEYNPLARSKRMEQRRMGLVPYKSKTVVKNSGMKRLLSNIFFMLPIVLFLLLSSSIYSLV